MGLYTLIVEDKEIIDDIATPTPSNLACVKNIPDLVKKT